MKLSSCLQGLNLSPLELGALSGDCRVNASTLHETAQGKLDVREYEPGCFEWRPDEHHCACVLEGLAEVALADGREVLLRPGTSFFLPAGVPGEWNVRQRLRTIAVCNR